MKFLIWSPEYNERWGGIVAIHKLAETISKLGYDVYTTSRSPRTESVKFISDYPDIVLPDDQTMVIYPEIVSGNPLGAKHVTRWLMYTPSIYGRDCNYADTDLIYKFWDYFKAPDESRVSGLLTCLDFKYDKFINMSQDRSGQCYLIKKGNKFNKNFSLHEPSALNIDNYISDDFLLKVFNEKEIFISYDSASYHSIQAALCGCISVVIPDPNVSREEWRNKLPINKYGIAYGLDDIEWARNTKHLVKDYLVEFEKSNLRGVIDYIENCKQIVSK